MTVVIDPEYFEMIIDDQKTYEICTLGINNEKFNNNDVVVIRDTNGRWFTAIITRVGYYNSLEDIFKNIPYKHFIPSAFSVNHAIMLYEQRNNFRHEELNGLVAFKMTRISEPVLNFKV
jgi:ASC-1-like (ASCH) protein